MPNENYIVRRINTSKAQILHQIRLKKFVPNQALEDNFREQRLQPNEEIVIPQDDLYIITWETDFGEQLITRGHDPIPTSLPNGERPSAAETSSSDANENEVDYIITRDESNHADCTAHSRKEQLLMTSPKEMKLMKRPEMKNLIGRIRPFPQKVKKNLRRIRI